MLTNSWNVPSVNLEFTGDPFLVRILHNSENYDVNPGNRSNSINLPRNHTKRDRATVRKKLIDVRIAGMLMVPSGVKYSEFIRPGFF
jgi:hypothetical protein